MPLLAELDRSRYTESFNGLLDKVVELVHTGPVIYTPESHWNERSLNTDPAPEGQGEYYPAAFFGYQDDRPYIIPPHGGQKSTVERIGHVNIINAEGHPITHDRHVLTLGGDVLHYVIGPDPDLQPSWGNPELLDDAAIDALTARLAA